MMSVGLDGRKNQDTMNRKSVLNIIQRITVEPVMFLYMLASFLQYSNYQALIYRRTCYLKYHNNTICRHLYNETYKTEDEQVQSDASSWIMYTNIAYSVPSILTVSLFLAPWGDRKGRKITIIIPIIGSMIYTLSNLIISNFPFAGNPYLLIGNLISGFAGGYVALMMAIYSYIGHTSSDDERTVKIGIAEAMISLSATLGVLVSGVMLDNTSFSFVFAFVLGVQFLALVYTVIFVKDVRNEGDITQNWNSLCSEMLSSFKDVWFCVSRRRENRKTCHLFVLVYVIFVLQTCTVGQGDIFYLYMKLPKFNWSQTIFGYNSALGHFTASIAVLVFLPLLRRMTNIEDTTLAVSGLLSKIAGLLLLALAAYTWQVFLVAVLAILARFPSVAVRSLMSSLVEKWEQGRLFGIVASVESISSFIATLIFNNLYSATVDINSSICFYFAMGLYFKTLLVILCLRRSMKRINIEMYSSMEEECN